MFSQVFCVEVEPLQGAPLESAILAGAPLVLVDATSLASISLCSIDSWDCLSRCVTEPVTAKDMSSFSQP